MPVWIWVVILAFVIFMIAAMWKIFTKAGQPGWAAIIPIYNYYIMTKITGKPGWWTILMIIPYVGLIWIIWNWNLMCKSFGKDVGFLLGIIFLPFIFIPILGFGDAKYLGPSAEGASNVGADILDA